jgi:hypothetical protein
MARTICAPLERNGERRCLTACMRKLDTDPRPLRVRKVDYRLEGRNL